MFYPRSIDRREHHEWAKERRTVMRGERDLLELLNTVIEVNGNVVIVANKRVILYISELLRKGGFNVEVYGDLNRNVVDYVLVDKGNGKIMLVSPHSRVGFGVNPPVENPRVIVLLPDIRRPAREYVKLSRDVYGRLIYRGPDLGLMNFSVVREGDVYYVAVNDGRHTLLFVYDKFDAKYDRHMLIQIIG